MYFRANPRPRGLARARHRRAATKTRSRHRRALPPSTAAHLPPQANVDIGQGRAEPARAAPGARSEAPPRSTPDAAAPGPDPRCPRPSRRSSPCTRFEDRSYQRIRGRTSSSQTFTSARRQLATMAAATSATKVGPAGVKILSSTAFPYSPAST